MYNITIKNETVTPGDDDQNPDEGEDPKPTTVTLTNVKVTKSPTKTSYTEGEKFDKTGMVVTAEYSNGTSKDIVNYTYSPSGELKKTDKEITISYTEDSVTKTAVQNITVVEKVEEPKEESVTPDKELPQTGIESNVVIILIAIAAVLFISYLGYRKCQ